MKLVKLALAAAVAAAPLTAGGPAAAQNKFIAIGTGGPTGVYFVVGNAICRMIHKEAAEGRPRNTPRSGRRFQSR
ncbi:MAG: hypothetical protein AAFR16_04980 [Pseudomonadota bacterium]